jgi:hypothetical protein
LKGYEFFELNSDSALIDSDSVYYIAKYELNKELGIVENLQLAVENGKIFEVRFQDGRYTKHDRIKNLFDSTLLLQSEDNSGYTSYHYISPANSIEASITYTDKRRHFRFFDSNVVQEIQNRADSIYKNAGIQEAIRQKEEYMKDMPIKKK